MSITLRPYQEAAVNHALEMLTETGNSLIVAGTGAGKTIMMAAVIGRYVKGFTAVHNRKPHVLVLVHRTEIHTQNYQKFSLVNPDIGTSEITADKKSLKGHVHFGMVQTVENLLQELARGKCFFDLIVIDEAHHAAASTYTNIIDWNAERNPDMALLGVTATPNRGDKVPLINLFDNFYQITSKYLIENHYLVRPTFLDLSVVFSTAAGPEKGHIMKNAKTEEQLSQLVEKLCNDYLENKQEGKTVIFAPNHDVCKLILEKLKVLGRNPAYLGNNIDDLTRKAEIEKFEKGDAEELINVDICTEGYDFPPLRNLVDFDTNGTHGQWVQKVGRVLRTAPEKTTCLVIDFGGNVDLYPDGVETCVNLEGAVKKGKGHRLTEDDLFKEPKEKMAPEVREYDNRLFTPYHLPNGFESVGDTENGTAFVACYPTMDCLVVPFGDNYKLFTSDKQRIREVITDDFNACMTAAVSALKTFEFVKEDKPISKIQIALLAPQFPTSALDWYGANCCICYKTWREDILKQLKGETNE